MNRKQRRKMRRIAGKIRGWSLTAMTIMAAYLVLCGVGITGMPEYGPDWYPVQVSMVVVGGGWLTMFMAANGAFDEMDLSAMKEIGNIITASYQFVHKIMGGIHAH